MKPQSLSIAEVIREERKKAGLSQAELGKRLGVSQYMIAQYECGIRIPKIPTIRRIADALEADLEPFFGNKEIDAYKHCWKHWGGYRRGESK